MKDLGSTSFVLRDCSQDILELSRKSYIEKVLKRFGMQDCKLGDTPIVKRDKFSLGQVCKHSDIAYIVGMLGRYLSNLGIDH